MSDDTLTFTCDFPDGAKATMEVSKDPPKDGGNHIRSIKWDSDDGTASTHLRHYIRWMNSVNQSLADRWEKKMMHIYQLSPDPKTWQLWKYEPGGKPEKIEFNK